MPFTDDFETTEEMSNSSAMVQYIYFSSLWNSRFIWACNVARKFKYKKGNCYFFNKKGNFEWRMYSGISKDPQRRYLKWLQLNMETKTLKGISKEIILHAFNLSFSDYFVPFCLTPEQLDSKMFADKVDLDLSVGIFEERRLVAFILHGITETNGQKICYNGGTGVIPQKRGLGLTAKMYAYMLPILMEMKFSAVWLEVISENIPAIKSYEKAGFKSVRNVSCYKGIPKVVETNMAVEIKKLDTYNWGIMKSFWDITPTWQNSNHVLDRLKKDTVSLGAYYHNLLVGYVIYNPNSKRIQQIAIDKKWRKQKIASTLISSIGKVDDNLISVINVDEGAENVQQFFKKMGLDKYLEQIEMKLEI